MFGSSQNHTLFAKQNFCISLKSNGLLIEGETQRLFIRSYQDHDINDCVSLYGDKRITKYFDHGEPRSKHEVDGYVKSRGRKYFDKGEPFGLFSVFLKKSRIFIGQVDLVPTGFPGVIEIGWIFHLKYHNQGYCTEAVSDFLMILVDTLIKRKIKSDGNVIRKIIATAHPDNTASNKMIQKIGMTFEKFQERYGGKPRMWYSYFPKMPILSDEKFS